MFFKAHDLKRLLFYSTNNIQGSTQEDILTEMEMIQHGNRATVFFCRADSSLRKNIQIYAWQVFLKTE